jgi:hypothetical protein
MSQRVTSVNKDGMNLSKPFPLTILYEFLLLEFLCGDSSSVG